MRTTIDHRQSTPEGVAPRGDRRSVAVIGGGITGLTAALELKRRGVPVTCFEAGPVAGGNIRSSRVGEYLVEHGPHTLLTSAPVNDLIAWLGLGDQVVPANPQVSQRFVVRGGRLVPFPTTPLSLLTTRLLSLPAKLRVLFEPLVRRRTAPDDESVAAFVRRRLGREVLDYAVNPFVAGIFAGDPELLSIRHTLPRVVALEAEHGSLSAGLMAGFRAARRRATAGPPDAAGAATAPAATGAAAASAPAPMHGLGASPSVISFTNGLQVLVDGLTRALGSDLVLRTPVGCVHRRDDRWMVETVGDAGDGQSPSFAFDAVVLAVPTHALAAMELPAALRRFAAPIEAVEYPPVATVTLGFRREAVAHPLNGFGYLVPEVERRSMLGTLFTSTLFPARAPEGHVALACFVGGTRAPELAMGTTESIVSAVMPDLRALLGVRESPVFVKRVAWPRAIPQYTLGYDAVQEAADLTEQANPGFYLAGNFRHGVSVGDCVTTAQRTAERVASYLARTN